VKGPAVGFDSDLLARKRDIDFETSERAVGLPSGYVVVSQQLDQQAFGCRARTVGCRLQQSPRGG